MKKAVLLSACLLLTVGMYSQTIMGRQIVDQFQKNSNGDLTYGLTWLPTSYANTTRTYPLIIFLHGAGETGTSVAELSKLYTASPRSVAGAIANGWNAVAVNPLTGVQDSFIVVSPQASTWSYSYTELKYMLPAILNKYRIDRTRIYLTGLSAGGGGTFSTLGSRDSIFIKNFAAMATASSAGVNASNGYSATGVEAGLRFGSSYGVRTWTIAGEQDYLLNADVAYHDSTNMLSPNPPNKLTVIQGVGHSAWGRAYDPNFRPTANYYGKTGSCNNGCNNGGIQIAPNANGSSVRGSGKTQDSLNLYEWLLLSQRTSTAHSPNIGDYKTNAPKPNGGKWSNTSSWRKFDGNNWVAASTVPGASAGIITISNNDSIDIDVAVTANQLVVETNGSVNIQTAGLTINDGPGTDFLVNGVMYLGNLQMIGGMGNAEINGTFNWNGGTLSLKTTANASSVVNLDGNFTKTIGANFNNKGTFNWVTGNTSGDIALSNSIFTNDGLINEAFSSSRGFVNNGGTVAIVNNGTFKKMSSNSFLNNGISFANTGTLQGIGSFNFTPGTIVNNGIVKPGNSPGILFISEGAITGQSSSISIEIFDGSGPGSGHNQLDLTGNISLNGNRLIVTENSGVPHQSYVIMTTTGAFTGTFTSASLPAGYSITYNSNNVVVSKASGTLPVVWGVFDVIETSGQAELKWATLQEENTSYFEVEHSTTGNLFDKIGIVQAQGKGSFSNNYYFKHKNLNLYGVNYYRLKLIDLDGKFSISVVKALKIRRTESVKVSMTSNLVRNNLQMIVNENRINIKIIDMSGRVYLNSNFHKGMHNLYVGNYSSGIYRVVIMEGNKPPETKSFVIQ